MPLFIISSVKLLKNLFDLNDKDTNGTYKWAGSTPVNAPSGTYHNMFVQADGGQSTQMVWGGSYGGDGADISIRRNDSGSWTAWTHLLPMMGLRPLLIKH